LRESFHIPDWQIIHEGHIFDWFRKLTSCDFPCIQDSIIDFSVQGQDGSKQGSWAAYVFLQSIDNLSKTTKWSGLFDFAESDESIFHPVCGRALRKRSQSVRWMVTPIRLQILGSNARLRVIHRYRVACCEQDVARNDMRSIMFEKLWYWFCLQKTIPSDIITSLIQFRKSGKSLFSIVLLQCCEKD
jgi:hypothetical protein